MTDQTVKTHEMQIGPWVIERKINLPTLFAIFSAIITAVVWANSVANKVSGMERTLENVPTQLENIRIGMAVMGEQIKQIKDGK